MTNTELTSWQDITEKEFKDFCVNKGVIYRSDLNIPGFPRYVSESLIMKLANGDYSEENLNNISSKVPGLTLEQDSTISKRMFLGDIESKGEALLFTFMTVDVDLTREEPYILMLEDLELNNETISGDIINNDEHKNYLISGCWGFGKFKKSHHKKSQVNLIEFAPIKTTTKLKGYQSRRHNYDLKSWIDLLMNSFGINHEEYGNYFSKITYLSRFIPLVEPRVCMIEFALPATGKTFPYENATNFSVVLKGKDITPAQLFYNRARKTKGYFLRKDVVVFDDVHVLKNHKVKEIEQDLLHYLSSFSVKTSKMPIASDTSLLMYGNTDTKEMLDNLQTCIMKCLPESFHHPAHLSRINGIIPGKYVPQIRPEMKSNNIGLTSDFLSSIFHQMRPINITRVFQNIFRENIDIIDLENNGIDERDSVGIINIASGIAKILFPDAKVTKTDIELCIQMGINYRQPINDLPGMIDQFGKKKFSYRFKDGSEPTIDPTNFDKQNNISLLTDLSFKNTPENTPISGLLTTTKSV